MYNYLVNNKFSVVSNNFKELPNNIEAEQAVIGSILTSNEIFDDVNTIINEKYFYDLLKFFDLFMQLVFLQRLYIIPM